MKTTPPIISIIVPVYRTEKYIHRCLDSIVSQTNQHFEAILMDDGSDDHCPSICDEYVAKYPDIFKVVHQKNQGISIVRNNGIKLSSGKFITFIDSDDYVSSTFIEDLIQGQSFNNPIVATNFTGAKEQLKLLSNCIVSNMSAEDIAKAIQSIIKIKL